MPSKSSMYDETISVPMLMAAYAVSDRIRENASSYQGIFSELLEYNGYDLEHDASSRNFHPHVLGHAILGLMDIEEPKKAERLRTMIASSPNLDADNTLLTIWDKNKTVHATFNRRETALPIQHQITFGKFIMRADELHTRFCFDGAPLSELITAYHFADENWLPLAQVYKKKELYREMRKRANLINSYTKIHMSWSHRLNTALHYMDITEEDTFLFNESVQEGIRQSFVYDTLTIHGQLGLRFLKGIANRAVYKSLLPHSHHLTRPVVRAFATLDK